MANASPFDQLLGLTRQRLPSSQSVHLVVNGKAVQNAHALNKTARALTADALSTGDPQANQLEQAQLAEAKKALAKAKAAAKYQRERANPEAMAKRRAWYEANKDKVRDCRKSYDKNQRARVSAQKAAHQKRAYHANPELMRQRSRDYYARNREAILARAQAKRDAAKAKLSQNPERTP